jgi:predicted nucleic acid-binding protein
MPTTLIDTNVLLDVLEERPQWSAWVLRQFQNLAEDGDLIINQIIYGEASVPYGSLPEFDALLSSDVVKREDFPWEAGFVAGKVHKLYRDGGGQKVSTLPDFLIGAHALVKGYRVLTRDASRFRTYFPKVQLIAPDTHP